MGRYYLKWSINDHGANNEIKFFLKKEGISRKALSAIKFFGGDIFVNGQKETVLYRLQKGDELEVYFPSEQENERLKAEPIPLDIVYEDKDVLVVNKPSAMSTIPSRDHPTGSLANGIKYYYKQIGLQSGIHIVTRLDRDTSGLVLVAKHRHIHHLFSLMQRKGAIKRFYHALAEGIMKQQSGVINKPIGRKSVSIIEREVRSDGQEAITYFDVLETFSEFTYVKLRLGTGRTHQIRVHLASIGHPLVGDDLYGGSRNLISRQALHCSEICFPHPIKQKDIILQSCLPEDMERLLSR